MRLDPYLWWRCWIHLLPLVHETWFVNHIANFFFLKILKFKKKEQNIETNVTFLEKSGQNSILLKHKIGCLRLLLVYHQILVLFPVYSLKHQQISPQSTFQSEPQIPDPGGLYNQSIITCLMITKEHIRKIIIMKSSMLVCLAHLLCNRFFFTGC